MTSSPATGGGLPPQVEDALQGPDCELVLVAANAVVAMRRVRTNVKRATERRLFMGGPFSSDDPGFAECGSISIDECS
jgi:hypothetical protein